MSKDLDDLLRDATHQAPHDFVARVMDAIAERAAASAPAPQPPRPAARRRRTTWRETAALVGLGLGGAIGLVQALAFAFGVWAAGNAH